MCEDIPCKPPDDAHPRWLEIRRFGKALRFRTRWVIIEYIGHGQKSSTEIFKHLVENGEQLTKPGFYYHLSELKNAGIIGVAEYLEEGGGAPVKVWKLKTKSININLLDIEKNDPSVSI
ncbi:MAG: winged helix-turn-helix domain-containing protein [Candidatus Thermoplasmatota archaeon]|nr:winged helix-turn-helix domain-containing protein [Candidatus Thermoplasmatota archaeon]